MEMGIPTGYPTAQDGHGMRNHEEVKISKRAGDYVTIRELVDEAGRDAVRYFLVSRKGDSEFVFDVDLARSQSDENPVYYVQYAHARMCSVLRQAGLAVAEAPRLLVDADLSPLTSPYEEALLRRLADFPAELEAAARDRLHTRSRSTSRIWPRNSTVTIMPSDSWSRTSRSGVRDWHWRSPRDRF
jgi:arginyl-tRNA synthetase